MMIKNIFFTGFILLTLAACQKYNVKIEGNIEGADKQQIYLDQLNVGGIETIDSAKTNRAGQFSFKMNEMCIRDRLVSGTGFLAGLLYPCHDCSSFHLR